MLTPATIADLDAMWPNLAARKYSPPGGLTYDRLARQLQSGPSWAWRVASHDAPALLVGFVRGDGVPTVVWLCVARPLGRDLIAAVRVLRGVVARGVTAEPRGIVTQTMPGNRNGERLARVTGFVPIGIAGGVMNWGYSAWNWSHCSDLSAPRSRPSTG